MSLINLVTRSVLLSVISAPKANQPSAPCKVEDDKTLPGYSKLLSCTTSYRIDLDPRADALSSFPDGNDKIVSYREFLKAARQDAYGLPSITWDDVALYAYGKSNEPTVNSLRVANFEAKTPYKAVGFWDGVSYRIYQLTRGHLGNLPEMNINLPPFVSQQKEPELPSPPPKKPEPPPPPPKPPKKPEPPPERRVKSIKKPPPPPPPPSRGEPPPTKRIK